MRKPLLCGRCSDVQHRLICVVFFGPHVPTKNTHNSVIEIYGSLPQQVPVKADVDVDNCIYQPGGINQYIFFSAIPYTDYSRKYRQVFKPSCIRYIL